MKIAVAGMGYVGLSNAVLLARKYDVVGVDVNEDRVRLIKERKCPIADSDLEQYLTSGTLSLDATTDGGTAYKDADFIIIATPTDYDPESGRFNTSTVEAVLECALAVNKNAVFVIRSTVSIGYTKTLHEKYDYEKIIFAPEFLREGSALYDSLHPSRIIVGCSLDNGELHAKANEFLDILKLCVLKKDAPVLLMETAEAEAVKLFSNTCLALRVAFFNELDTYAEMSGMRAGEVIKGVCLDPRIGDFYNNPSFGYGGYCLPKDTKQLRSNYSDIPNKIIGAVVDANRTRKDFIADRILSRNPRKIGIFRLTMKSGSDNFRDSSALGIMRRLINSGAQVVVYEPLLTGKFIYDTPVENDLTKFKEECDLIITNRYDKQLDDVSQKVYTRDLFKKD